MLLIATKKHLIMFYQFKQSGSEVINSNCFSNQPSQPLFEKWNDILIRLSGIHQVINFPIIYNELTSQRTKNGFYIKWLPEEVVLDRLYKH